MGYRPGDTFAYAFVVKDPATGLPTAPDSPPTATAEFDGPGTGAMTLTVASDGPAGKYKATGTVPATRARGDTLHVTLSATKGGLTYLGVVREVIESDPLAVAAPGAYAAGTAGNMIGNLATPVPSSSLVSLFTSALSTTPVKLTPDAWDNIVVEAGVNARQALSPILAACAGVVAGAGTGTVVLKAAATSGTPPTRISAATDAAGNRTSVTLTLPT